MARIQPSTVARLYGLCGHSGGTKDCRFWPDMQQLDENMVLM